MFTARTRLIIAALLVALPSVAFAEGVDMGVFNLKLGLRLAGGGDTNVFYTSSRDSAEDVFSPTLQVIPRLQLETNDSASVAAKINFSLTHEQFLSEEANGSEHSGLSLGGMAEARFLPRANVSFMLRDSLRRTAQPGADEGAIPVRNWSNKAEAELALHPGGSDVDSRAGFSGAVRAMFHSRWAEERPQLDRNAYGGELIGRYNFLPRTGIYFRSAIVSNIYENEVTSSEERALTPGNRDSINWRAVGGFNGLFTHWFALTLEAGATQSLFRDEYRVTSFAGVAEGKFKVGEIFSMTLGGSRNVGDSVFGDALILTRASARAEAEVSIFSLEAGLSYNWLNFPGLFSPVQEFQGTQVSLYSDDERVDQYLEVMTSAMVKLHRTVGIGVSYGMRSNDSDFHVRYSSVGSGDDLYFDYLQHRFFLFLDVRN